jgi:hypothetical protein
VCISCGAWESLPNLAVSGFWRQITASSPWSPSDGSGLLTLGDDLFRLGGWGPGFFPDPYTHSEVWKSSDGGRNWTKLPDAPWEARHSAGWLVHDNKLWVIGGDLNLGHYQKDVWWSADGINWTQATANAAPLSHGRVLHNVYSHAGKMWIVGGQTLDEAATSGASTKPGSVYYDDVWSSTDGITWTLVSSGNAWAPNGMAMGSAVKDGFMWLLGGGAYDTEGNPRIYKDDIWKSSDGVTWTLVTSAAGFPARHYQCVGVLKDDLVVVAGYNGANLSDAWASRDGLTWRPLNNIPGLARHAASLCLYNDELLLLGGPLSDTSVWALR